VKANGPRLSCGAPYPDAATVATGRELVGAQTEFFPEPGAGSFKR